MKFEYTGRHVDVSPAIRRHVEEHFKKLDHVFNGDSTLSTHVVIDVEKNRQIGEIIVHWRDHTLTAKDTSADMYMALTRRSEEHTSELQSPCNLVCRLLLEKKNKKEL